MNFSKSLVMLGVAASMLIGCKDTAGKPTASEATQETVADAPKTPAVAAKPETAQFKIEGMTCAMGCAKTIEKRLAKMEGVQKATVDFDKKEATVEFDAAVLTPQKLYATVEATGDGATYKVAQSK
ncbi:heavy-metal-associated domain-containing protein [Flavobacterium sedimenticola]|uniref:Heavy metal-associated domain-containing protein n=1 Tax=Flavobacterium sedimenticola TaxID=3043286 RepID=A0ABT6XLI3_9FLAO|nr:heavy metal-associated domain-containing protein [Flavobacterium sedimenticola]MDI9255873.1 heavy metal-associated domain-containing protein [Flavobacterium sedimenticola]